MQSKGGEISAEERKIWSEKGEISGEGDASLGDGRDSMKMMLEERLCGVSCRRGVCEGVARRG